MALELLNYIRDLSPISMGCAELNSQNCSLLGLEGVVQPHETDGKPEAQGAEGPVQRHTVKVQQNLQLGLGSSLLPPCTSGYRCEPQHPPPLPFSM